MISKEDIIFRLSSHYLVSIGSSLRNAIYFSSISLGLETCMVAYFRTGRRRSFYSMSGIEVESCSYRSSLTYISDLPVIPRSQYMSLHNSYCVFHGNACSIV